MRASRKPQLEVDPATGEKFSIDVEEITPEIAQKYLDMSGPNRKISRAQVQKWVRAMSAGQWRLTGESIKFNVNGEMIDGRHRMTACVESGATIPMTVARGCGLDVFPVLDDGKRRSGGDVLSVMGDVEHVQAAAATLKIIKAYALARRGRTSLIPTMQLGRLANWEIGPWYEAHSGISDWIPAALSIHRKVNASSSGSAVAAALYLGSLLNYVDTVSFAEHLVSGENLSAGEAPLLLLNRSKIVGVNTSGESGQAVTLILVGKALNLWWAGKTQSCLPFNPDRLPDLGDPEIPAITLEALTGRP